MMATKKNAPIEITIFWFLERFLKKLISCSLC